MGAGLGHRNNATIHLHPIGEGHSIASTGIHGDGHSVAQFGFNLAPVAHAHSARCGRHSIGIAHLRITRTGGTPDGQGHIALVRAWLILKADIHCHILILHGEGGGVNIACLHHRVGCEGMGCIGTVSQHIENGDLPCGGGDGHIHPVGGIEGLQHAAVAGGRQGHASHRGGVDLHRTLAFIVL